MYCDAADVIGETTLQQWDLFGTPVQLRLCEQGGGEEQGKWGGTEGNLSIFTSKYSHSHTTALFLRAPLLFPSPYIASVPHLYFFSCLSTFHCCCSCNSTCFLSLHPAALTTLKLSFHPSQLTSSGSRCPRFLICCSFIRCTCRSLTCAGRAQAPRMMGILSVANLL